MFLAGAARLLLCSQPLLVCFAKVSRKCLSSDHSSCRQPNSNVCKHLIKGGLELLLIQRKKSGWGVGPPLCPPPKSSLISIGEEILMSLISSLVSLQKERVQNVCGLCEGGPG